MKEYMNEDDTPFSKEQFIEKIKTDKSFAEKFGNLGPIYGKQWRSWAKFNEKVYSRQIREVPEGGRFAQTRNVNWVGGSEVVYIDQIANLINELRANPDSRRLMVNAWNVGELDSMVLPPCHYGFQVYTRELTVKERVDYGDQHNMWKLGETISEMHCDVLTIPKRAISLMWNQRSVDVPLGLPFNIASYGLLLEIIAKEVNMVPDELIGNLGDCHIYANQIDGVKEQIGRELTTEERNEWHLINRCGGNIIDCKTDWKDFELDQQNVPKRTREPFKLPKLKIHDWYSTQGSPSNDTKLIIEMLDSITPIRFSLENYKSHPSIKMPLSN